MEENCGNCRFQRQGSCRRKAPISTNGHTAFLSQIMGHIAWAAYIAAGIDPEHVKEFNTEPSGIYDEAFWPRINTKEDWCGEYIKLGAA